MTSSIFPKELSFLNPFDLKIIWDDGHTSIYKGRELRLQCPCAHCVSEITGERILDPHTVPQNVRPLKLDYVGRYALAIQWSDDHNTGYYSFEYLRKLDLKK